MDINLFDLPRVKDDPPLFNSGFYHYSIPVDNVSNTVKTVRLRAVLDRPVALVGLMGSGKSTLGRTLAEALGLSFVDADDIVVKRAGKPIAAIFAQDGEAAFRTLERTVIADLMSAGPKIIATGGGAFMNDSTRTLIGEKAISLWLKADLPTLVKRTAGDRNRPLLAGGDPSAILSGLMDTRYPVYAQADITVETGRESPEKTLGDMIDALCRHTGC